MQSHSVECFRELLRCRCVLKDVENLIWTFVHHVVMMMAYVILVRALNDAAERSEKEGSAV